MLTLCLIFAGHRHRSNLHRSTDVLGRDLTAQSPGNPRHPVRGHVVPGGSTAVLPGTRSDLPHSSRPLPQRARRLSTRLPPHPGVPVLPAARRPGRGRPGLTALAPRWVIPLLLLS